MTRLGWAPTAQPVGVVVGVEDPVGVALGVSVGLGWFGRHAQPESSDSGTHRSVGSGHRPPQTRGAKKPQGSDEVGVGVASGRQLQPVSSASGRQASLGSGQTPAHIRGPTSPHGCIGVGLAGHPCRARFTALTSSSMVTVASSLASAGAQPERSPVPRAMATMLTSSLIATTAFPSQSPVQGWIVAPAGCCDARTRASNQGDALLARIRSRLRRHPGQVMGSPSRSSDSTSLAACTEKSNLHRCPAFSAADYRETSRSLRPRSVLGPPRAGEALDPRGRSWLLIDRSLSAAALPARVSSAVTWFVPDDLRLALEIAVTHLLFRCSS